MGLITIFVQENCPYCEKVKEIVNDFIIQVKQYVDMEMKSNKNANYYQNEPELKVQFVEAVGANAALCARLTGSTTVPHVFFNSEYIGDSTAFCCMNTKDKIFNKNCSQECIALARGKLFQKILQLSLTPSADFPPPCEAMIVKLTNQVACSSQPTEYQLKGLSKMGFNSVVNLSPCQTRAFVPDEAKIVKEQGLEYHHLPCDTTNGNKVDSKMIENARKLIKSAKSPVLVHDMTGTVSSLVVILDGIQNLNPKLYEHEEDAADNNDSSHSSSSSSSKMQDSMIDVDAIIGWGEELDVDFTKFRDLISGYLVA